MSVSLKTLRVTPSNPQQFYQASLGTSLVRFSLPDGAYLMSSMRLSGRLRCSTVAADALPTNQDVRIPQFAGIHGAWQQLTVTARRSSRVLERIQNYPRLAAAMNTATKSSDNLLTDSSESLASGSQNACTLYLRDETDWSMPLFSGVLSAPTLPLSPLGGLDIELQLSTAQQFLAGANAGDFDYRLSNLEISFDAVQYEPGAEQKLLKSLGAQEILGISSFYTLLQGNDETRQVSTGHLDTIATIASYIPSANVNSIAEDTTAPAPFAYTSLSYSRGGQQDPVQFVTRRPTATIRDAEVVYQKATSLVPYRAARSYGQIDVLGLALRDANYQAAPFGWRLQNTAGVPTVETRFFVNRLVLVAGPKGVEVVG